MGSRVLLAFALLLAATTTRGAKHPWPTDAIVLCYHVVESPADTIFTISRETFRQQLDYLESTGFNIVPLAHVHDYVNGKRASLPPNPVVITIDDGWRCTYSEFYPEMKKRGLPFTAFIYPNIIEKTAYALTWKQVREMSDDGVDIQSHSMTHPFLTRRRHGSMGPSKYGSWLESQLVESRKILEAKTGKKVRYLAYPYGDYDATVADASKRAGYSAALTCDFGEVTKGSDPFRMKRVVIYGKTTFAEFRRHLGSASLPIEAASPRSDETLDDSLPLVSARIPNHEDLDPKTVGLALIGRPAQPFHYNPETGNISTMVRDELSGSRQQVVIWGLDRKTGKRVEASWSFYSTSAALATAQEAKRVRAAKIAAAKAKVVAPAPAAPAPTAPGISRASALTSLRLGTGASSERRKR
jgi:peptidoglycan/xylan/chitin deacetylase (PgdA/CDA1 family)